MNMVWGNCPEIVRSMNQPHIILLPSSYLFYNNYRAFLLSLDKVSPSTEIILLVPVVTPAMCLFKRRKNINFYCFECELKKLVLDVPSV